MPPGTVSPIDQTKALASYSKESALCPLDLRNRHGNKAVVFWSKDTEGSDLVRAEEKPQDQITAEAFLKPATKDCILANLMRLSAVLHVKGAGKDDDGTQALFLLADFAGRLLDEEVLEVDLFLACEHFIETEESGFFPTYARLRKAIVKEERNKQ